MTNNEPEQTDPQQEKPQSKMVVMRKRSLVIALISLFIVGVLITAVAAVTFVKVQSKTAEQSSSFSKIDEVYTNISDNYYKKS